MKFCANCATANEDVAAFCTNCGTSVAASGGYVPVIAEPSFDKIPVVYPDDAPPGTRFIGQWNWGAAFLTPYWLMTHRKPAVGMIVLVIGLIPFVKFLTIFTLFYFGINGTKIAVNCGRFLSEETFVAVENAWRNWALALFPIGLLSGVLLTIHAFNHTAAAP